MRAKGARTAVLACVVLSACAPGSGTVSAPEYGPVSTALLDDDLVSFAVTMAGGRGPGDVRDFTDCAAAQYALIRGQSFARHVRTNLSEASGRWSADAVYTISAEVPRGTETLLAASAVAECKARGIPTI